MFTVSAIPAFADNYIWALHDASGRCVVVDPGASAPVLAWLKSQSLDLHGILITHHHWDHTGGIAELLETCKVPVMGPDNPQIDHLSQTLTDGQHCRVLDLDFEVLSVPGHTLDHIAYFNAEQQLLFCGDTLFHCGCGRLFEGSPEQLHASLQKLAALPGNTQVYCTHEYTLANMRFARTVDPDNQALVEAQQDAEGLRAQNRPTLPSDIATQRLINPFLRCDQPEIVASARTQAPDASTPTDVFAALRTWKDKF